MRAYSRVQESKDVAVISNKTIGHVRVEPK